MNVLAEYDVSVVTGPDTEQSVVRVYRSVPVLLVGGHILGLHPDLTTWQGKYIIFRNATLYYIVYFVFK